MTSNQRGPAETAIPAHDGTNEIYTAHQVHTLAQLMLQQIARAVGNPAQFQSIQQIQPQVPAPLSYGSYYPFIR